MPLPDERPRQSVANLIGRFEQQTKRQSLTPPNGLNIPIVPRAPSALSHHIGDAGKENSKEKTELQPKAKVASADVPEPVKDVEDVKPTSPVDAPVSHPTSSEPIIKADDVVPGEIIPDEKDVAPSAPEPQPQATSDPPSPERTQASAKTTIRAPSTPSKSRPIPTKAAPKFSRTPAKSPPSSYHTALPASTSAPSAPSLRASVSSPPSKAAARPRPSSSASNRPSVTPARAKTPSSSRPKTPSSSTPARAKSPASTTKTPSSGLFAPTAASLARARNAPEQPAVPIRKQTTSTTVSDRLSKPTAASLSKARTPTLLPQQKVSTATNKTLARSSTPARGTLATRGRGAAPKTRGGAPGAKAKDAKATVPTKKPAASPQEPVYPALTDDHPHVADEEEHQEVEVVHDQEGSATTTATLVEHHDAAGSAAEITQEPEHDELVLEKAEEHVIHDEPHHDADLEFHEHEADEVVVAEPEPVEAEAVVEAEPSTAEGGDETDDTHVADPVPYVKPADNLDDIVNMLESKPLFSSVHVEKNVKAAEDIDVAGEIPDEE
ncbi:unnamed protein product [Somion occarium]|uniref:Uncharacterized protein n=1 Tax=Somion occarium TaxID=3059160 RepID=A0ABP1EAM7_9APHY